MKSRKLNKLKYDKLDNKDRNFVKAFGEIHPINDIKYFSNFNSSNKRIFVYKRNENGNVRIVYDEEYEQSNSQGNKKKLQNNKAAAQEEKINDEDFSDLVAPYQILLDDLIGSELSEPKKRKMVDEEKKKKSKLEVQNNIEIHENQDQNIGELISEDEIDEANINSYSQEVLCKDNLESEELIKYDPFHIHFETNLDEKLVEKIKTNCSDKKKLDELKQNISWPGLGNLIYTSPIEETKQNLDPNKNIKQLFIKQRILERLNNSAAENISKHFDEEPEDNSEFKLENKQSEILNIISNYCDLYHSDIDVHIDYRIKFVYALHALNHVLKTRSRVIAHNDKLKQNKSNTDVEYRDQGLTRPKVLIVVPYRKFALKLIKIMIRLLMNKSEEYVSNKKRFFDSFGPDEDNANSKKDENEEKKLFHDEDYDFLFSGNCDDHFKIGLSVSKKSLKLFTEFYSSDIIIASPLGLKSVIGADGENQDHDFLSSIELLVLDNADVLLMQNWEHVVTVFDNLHLQPKKSHDTDFSRVRSWLLDGHARFYRQTLIFSRIPAPQINSIFNKYCTNYSGKYQIDLLKSSKYQLGTICKIGFQLAQVFNKIECDSLIDLPEQRFKFFIEKILPKFKDEMMSHTLIFVPTYFDFVKLRNYFKKNDISFMNISEYSDKKSVERARYFFFHGKVHFMLLTERFYFYKRYKIRGINHLIFFDLPSYAEYYSSFCNFLPDPKRFKNGQLETFSSTVLYSQFDAQKLCAIVGFQRANHMINSDKSVHMFMTE